jgi:hypothetical protein
LQVQQALLLLHGLADEGLAPGERVSLYRKPGFRLLTYILPRRPDCLAHGPLPAIVKLNFETADLGMCHP